MTGSMTRPAGRDARVGVVLLQLGGPDALASVEPFLYNLFSDPDIIDLPLAFLFRKRLARTISGKRTPHVQEFYKKIGRRSPILKLTLRQARALECELAKNINARVYVAMRYWHPLTDVAVEQIQREKISRVVLLPLYPQYSKTTTGSSVNEWNRVIAQRGVRDLDVSVVEEYCEHPKYIAALIRNIEIALARVPAQDRAKVHLVFSAHGTPMKLVRSGDPYQQQIIRTYNAVLREGKFGLSHHLCYQSKVGPQKWLEPSLFQTVTVLAKDGVTHLVVVPIAFVSDHSETLWEINMQMRQEAKKMGITYFDMSPALNTNPLFVRALADVVLRKIEI